MLLVNLRNCSHNAGTAFLEHQYSPTVSGFWDFTHVTLNVSLNIFLGCLRITLGRLRVVPSSFPFPWSWHWQKKQMKSFSWVAGRRGWSGLVTVLWLWFDGCHQAWYGFMRPCTASISTRLHKPRNLTTALWVSAVYPLARTTWPRFTHLCTSGLLLVCKKVGDQIQCT